MACRPCQTWSSNITRRQAMHQQQIHITPTQVTVLRWLGWAAHSGASTATTVAPYSVQLFLLTVSPFMLVLA